MPALPPALTLEVLVRVKGSDEVHEIGEIDVPIRLDMRPNGPLGHPPGVRGAQATAEAGLVVDGRAFRGALREFADDVAAIVEEELAPPADTDGGVMLTGLDRPARATPRLHPAAARLAPEG